MAAMLYWCIWPALYPGLVASETGLPTASLLVLRTVMDSLALARGQMGLSLAFHIVFAAVGVALPLLMVIADILHLRTGDDDYRTLSKQLAKGTAILFAVGAVSGTVLSFELGLLWPGFMARFGSVVGLAFSLEGFAFFTEAIFLGIYLYGRDRVRPAVHLASGIAVAVSGAVSAFFVTLVNAFMNNPGGLDPVAAMFSPSWLPQTVHVLISSYQATAFAMAGIHAALLLRNPSSTVHRKALAIALPVACLTALVQPLSGDFSAKHVAHHQPVKLAAMEGQFHSERHAPLRIGGLPDEDRRETRFALEVPGGMSWLAFGDGDHLVLGLEAFPRDEWPPVARTHLAFQAMVGAGSAMAALALLTVVLTVRRRALPLGRPYLVGVVAASPLGLVALEAGWLVTEWGRQPWIVRGLMRTSQAVTPFPHLGPGFFVFTLVYLLLGAVVLVLLFHQARASDTPSREAARAA
jgi:cytochrome d ubiquinol oxidase subunit I